MCSFNGVALADFSAVEGMAPVVDFVNRLDVRGIGWGKGEHGDW
jgi:hypothetical protein